MMISIDYSPIGHEDGANVAPVLPQLVQARVHVLNGALVVGAEDEEDAVRVFAADLQTEAKVSMLILGKRPKNLLQLTGATCWYFLALASPQSQMFSSKSTTPESNNLQGQKSLKTRTPKVSVW